MNTTFTKREVLVPAGERTIVTKSVTIHLPEKANEFRASKFFTGRDGEEKEAVVVMRVSANDLTSKQKHNIEEQLNLLIADNS